MQAGTRTLERLGLATARRIEQLLGAFDAFLGLGMLLGAAGGLFLSGAMLIDPAAHRQGVRFLVAVIALLVAGVAAVAAAIQMWRTSRWRWATQAASVLFAAASLLLFVKALS